MLILNQQQDRWVDNESLTSAGQSLMREMRLFMQTHRQLGFASAMTTL